MQHWRENCALSLQFKEETTTCYFSCLCETWEISSTDILSSLPPYLPTCLAAATIPPRGDQWVFCGKQIPRWIHPSSVQRCTKSRAKPYPWVLQCRGCPRQDLLSCSPPASLGLEIAPSQMSFHQGPCFPHKI